MGVYFPSAGGIQNVKLHRSGEDYLKTILILQNKNGCVRSTDVAEHLKVSKASVSRAMKLLCEGGFLTMGEHKKLHLTALGVNIAEEICERHRILNDLLLSLGVEPAVAELDACRIEHVVSRETLEKVKSFCSKPGFGMASVQASTA